MPTPLQTFREQFPQYHDVDDETLGSWFHGEHYSDMPLDDYREWIGLPPIETLSEPTRGEQIDRALTAPSHRMRSSGGELLNDVPDYLRRRDPLSRDAIGPPAPGQERAAAPEIDVSMDERTDEPGWIYDTVRHAPGLLPIALRKADEAGFLSNALRLAGQRGSSLLGSAVKGIVGAPGRALEERFPRGQIVFGTDWGEEDPDEGKFRVRYMKPDELEALESRGGEITDVLTESVPDYLQTRDFGGERRNTPEEIKSAWESGDVSDTLGATLRFGLETGIESVPDMVAVMAGGWGLLAYVGARSSEIGDIRAEHKGKDESDLQDQLEALPFAVGSALLERLGARGIAHAGAESAEQIGRTTIREGLARVSQATGRATGREAMTEAMQEGVIEYVAERWGTDVGMDVREMFERGAFGALAGGTYAAAGGGSMAASRELGRQIGARRSPQPAPDAPPATPEPAVPALPAPQGAAATEAGPGPAPAPEGAAAGPGPAPADAAQQTRAASVPADTAAASIADPRLGRLEYRLRLAALGDELAPVAGATAGMADDTARASDPDDAGVTPRTPSLDPPWYQSLNADPDLRMSSAGVRRAVDKALNDQPLGVREARVVGGLLDAVSGERSAHVPTVRRELERARALRRTARQGLEAEAAGAVPLAPAETYEVELAGELLDETEYLPGMDGEARALYELTAIADQAGLGEQVDAIFAAAATNAEAVQQLEARLNEHTTDPAGVEAAPGQQGARAQAEVQAAPGQARAADDAQALEEGVTPAGDRRRADATPADDRRAGRERRDAERRARFEALSLDEQIAELYTDPLTGLGNRRAFEEAAADAPWIASIDADGLKAVNDNLGHDAGDAMLQAIGQAMGAQDLEAFHISGDEFYLIGDSEAQLAGAIEGLKGQLGRQVVEVDAGRVMGIDFTAGIGPTKSQADSVMEAAKLARTERGDRAARGELGDRLVRNSSTLDMGAGTNYVPLVGKLGDLPLNANHEYVLGNGRTVRIPAKPVRKRHIIRLLERKFGAKIYDGRVKGPKTRLGFYRLNIGEIRTRHKNDLEVTAHEFAHWLDDRNPWVERLYKRYRDEIVQVSYDDSKDFEGFAEFGRLWLTQEHKARAAAPSFYDAWIAELSGHPKLRETLYELQELMHAWYLQGARARLASKIGKDKLSIRQWGEEVFDQWDSKLLQRVFDGLRRFKDAERDIRGGELGDATVSGYKSLRLARGAHGVVRGMFHRGTVNWNAAGDLEFTGKGLEAVFAPIEDRKDTMQQYMVARRASELLEQGRENLLRPDEIAAGLRLGDLDPELVSVFDDWLAFNQRMFDFIEASGLVSAQSRAKIEEMNRSYVPFNRVAETAMGQRVKRGGGTPLMRLRGGTGNVNDVFDNIISNLAYLTQMALINRGKGNFYRMIDAAEGQTAAMYAVPISTDTRPVQVDQEQVLRTIVESMGLTMKWYRQASTGVVASDEEATIVAMINQMASGMEEFVTFWQHGQDPKGNVDFYWEDGKKRFYEIGDPLLMESIAQIGPQAHNLAVNILGGFANVLRRGVTLTPTFQAKNLIRDTNNAFTLSRGQIVPVAGAGKALLERIWSSDHYWEYMINGGGFASMAQADGINADRVLDTPNKIWDFYDRFLSAFEYANRIAEFSALRKKGTSAREAAFLGREISSDFAMRGSSEALRVITISVPFMNARLQGLYRMAREVGELRGPQYRHTGPEGAGPDAGPGARYRPRARFLGARAFSWALRSLISITLPSLWLYAMNKDDERYQEMPEWIKDLSWVIFYGPGEDDYAMIPKPFETGALWGTIPERMVERYYSEDNAELADAMLWMAGETFALDPTPQAFKPIDELRRNERFTGAPIVPEYLQGAAPSVQRHHYTSEAMVALGRKLGVSPMQAEHLVRGYFGTLGTWALGAADYMVGDIDNTGAEPARPWYHNVLTDPFINHGPLRRTKSETDFYDMLQSTREVVRTFNQMDELDPQRAEAYLQEPGNAEKFALNSELESISTEVRAINNVMDQIHNNPELSAEQKRDQLDERQREKNALLRQARLQLYPQFQEARDAQ